MESNERPDVTAVCGQTKMGKTTEVQRLLSESPRYLVLDTLCNDYSAGVLCYDFDLLRALWRRCYRGQFRMILRPADPDDIFPALCDLVLACGDLTFVVEEAQLYFKAGVCCREFTRIITHGSHYGVRLIAVTQSPKRFGDLLRSQAHEWIIFTTREVEHVIYLRRRLPGVSEDQIALLPPHTYIHYNDSWDCYYICRRDLATGRLQRVEHAYDRQQEAGVDWDAGNRGSLGVQSQDHPQDSSVSRPGADSPG